jgi:hypothetical protein
MEALSVATEIIAFTTIWHINKLVFRIMINKYLDKQKIHMIGCLRFVISLYLEPVPKAGNSISTG